LDTFLLIHKFRPKPFHKIDSSYPNYEWKVEEKKPAKQPTRGVGTLSTVNLATVDIKHVAQIPISQATVQQVSQFRESPFQSKNDNFFTIEF
jgi:hypothetical protein